VSVSVINKAHIDEAVYKKTLQAIDEAVQKLLPDLKYNIALTLCDNSYIKELNKQYRDIDKETDVLSFPLLESDEPGEIIVSDYDKNPETDEIMLGDIVISYEKAQEQSMEYGHSVERELCYLSVHSVLHLFGYDHMEDGDRKLMRKKEEEILESMGIGR
jgi:probable rRNA maturation factor